MINQVQQAIGDVLDKSDNNRTETGHKWTEHYRAHQIVQKTIEPHCPLKNYTEHGIKELLWFFAQ